jgi:hypothetical protein
MKYSRELAVLMAMDIHHETGHVEKFKLPYRPKQFEFLEGILQPIQGQPSWNNTAVNWLLNTAVACSSLLGVVFFNACNRSKKHSTSHEPDLDPSEH